MFCGGEDGSIGQAEQHEVWLAVKESIVREATGTQELTKENLMSMTFNLAGKSNAVTFVAYSSAGTVSNTREHRDAFWVDLDITVSRVHSSDYLFYIYALTMTGVRIREDDCKVIGAYGIDTQVSDSKGTSLSWLTGDNKLALVNTLFSVPKGYTSCTFNGTDPRIENVLTASSRGSPTAS